MFRFGSRDLGLKPVERIKKWKVLRGDLVEIEVGKDKGRQGFVKKVDRKNNTVFVEGLRLAKKSVKGTEEHKGGVIFKEAPIHVSNVAVVDPSDRKPCKVSFRFDEEGKKIRVSRRTGTLIPRPAILTEKKHKSTKLGAKDTPPNVVLKKTFDEWTLLPEISEEVLRGAYEKMKLAEHAQKERDVKERFPKLLRDIADRQGIDLITPLPKNPLPKKYQGPL